MNHLLQDITLPRVPALLDGRSLLPLEVTCRLQREMLRRHWLQTASHELARVSNFEEVTSHVQRDLLVGHVRRSKSFVLYRDQHRQLLDAPLLDLYAPRPIATHCQLRSRKCWFSKLYYDGACGDLHSSRTFPRAVICDRCAWKHMLSLLAADMLYHGLDSISNTMLWSKLAHYVSDELLVDDIFSVSSRDIIFNFLLHNPQVLPQEAARSTLTGAWWEALQALAAGGLRTPQRAEDLKALTRQRAQPHSAAYLVPIGDGRGGRDGGGAGGGQDGRDGRFAG